MQNVMSPLVSMYQCQLEMSKRCADAVFAGTEKLDHVMIEATHRAFNDQIDLVQAMAAARLTPGTSNGFQPSRLFSRSPDNALNYQTEIMRIVAEMQNEIGKSLREYVEDMGSTASSASMASTFSSDAARTRATMPAFNPMTSMFSVWESAFKDVASMANKNMMAARSTMEDSASRAMQQAGNTVTAMATGMREASEDVVNKIRSAAIASEDRGGTSHAGGKKK
jgi:hypothetical protein